MQEASVTVPLLRPDQAAPRSGGPTGRVRRLSNGIVQKHRDDGSIKAQKRGGFQALSRNVSRVTDAVSLGAIGTPGTTLMATLGDELVQIGDSVPHVYSPTGPRYEQFTDDLVMTETAHRDIVYAGTQTISEPDGAALGGIACYVWQAGGACYASFVDLATKTPVRTPFQVASAGRVKVVSDGVRFWIVTDSGGVTVTVVSYGTNGLGQASATLTTTGVVLFGGAPWDITAMPGTGNGIVIAHNVNVGVDYIRMAFATFSAGSIVVTGPVFNTHLPATFGVSWLRNDFDPNHLYLATVAQFIYTPGGADPVRQRGIYVGRMSLTGVHDVIYIVDGTLTAAQATSVSALTGYVDNVFGCFVSWTMFEHNGGLRGSRMNSTTTTRRADPEPSASVPYGVKRSVSLAGRAFKLGTRYVIPTYYASTIMSGALVNFAVPVAQPTYFLVDVAKQKIAGELEFGTAAMDWCFNNWDPAQVYGPGFFMLPSPFTDSDGIVHLPFGFAADEQTVQVIDPDFGTTANHAQTSAGLVDIQLGGRGVPVAFADELLLPGPRAVSFARDAFLAAGFELGAEAPTVTGVFDAAGTMESAETHRHAIVYSAIDSRGNRIRSIASIPTAAVQITGGNNAMQLVIPMLRMTNYPKVLIEIYRDVWDTVANAAGNDLRKITVDEQTTGDARVPIYNDPTVDTYTFIDTVTNAAAAIGARLYTQDGTLDYEACPPFSTGCVFGDRVFVGGYDNRVYYSFSKVPGQAIAFNTDEFFITLPTREKVTAIVPLDNRIFFFCERRIFYVDGGNFLSADGTSGENPTPIELQFKDGCTGRAMAVTGGIAYHSSSGGFWLLTRGLEKIPFGQPVEDDTDGADCLDIAVDADQRIAFLIGGEIVTYDQVHGVWSPWTMPVSGVAMCAWQGRITWADNEATQRTYKQDPTVFSDNGTPIVTRVELGDISLADIHGFQVIWECEALGEWKGAHTFNVALTYDGSTVIDETFSEAFATAVEPFRFDWQPRNIECSSIGISVYDSFPGNVPSQGFTLEALGLYVGVERGAKYQERRIAPAG